MARLNSIGFELNNVSTANMEITNFSLGDSAISTTKFRGGKYATRFLRTTDGASWNSYDFLGSDSDTEVYIRFYLNITTSYNTNEWLFAFTSSANTIRAGLKLTTSDKLQLFNATTQVGSDSATLSKNTWYRVEMYYNSNNGVGSDVITARIDEVDFATSSTQTLDTVNRIRLGNFNGTGRTFEFYVDDVAINNSTGSIQNSWLGSGRIIHLKPTAAGDANAWLVGPNTDTFADIDEENPNDLTDYLATSGANGDAAYFNIEDMTGLDANGVVNCVQVGARFRQNNTDAAWRIAFGIKATSGGTIETSANIVATTTTWNTNAIATPRNYPLTLYDLPGASTTAWTKSTLDTTQIGAILAVENGTEQLQLSTLWLLVDFTPAKEITQSTSAIGSSATSVTFAHSVTGTNPLLVVGTTLDTNPDIINMSTVTYNGTSLTNIGRIRNATTTETELWYLAAPAAGSHDIVVTPSAAADFTVQAITISGMDQSAPLDTSNTATGTSTTPSRAITPGVNNTIIIDNVAIDDRGATGVPGAGQSEIADFAGDWNQHLMSLEMVDTAASTTMDWTIASNDWATIAASFKEYVAPAGGGTPPNWPIFTGKRFWGPFFA